MNNIDEQIATLRKDCSAFDALDDREMKEVMLAVAYVTTYKHGTSGHLAYTVIYKLFTALMQQQ